MASSSSNHCTCGAFLATNLSDYCHSSPQCIECTDRSSSW